MLNMLTFENIKKAFKKPKFAFSYLWSKFGYILWLPIPASQFWEDLILNYLIRKDNWFYIDIWANDPCWWNNTCLFYNKWWEWITIEPNKRLAKNIKKYRPMWINLNLGVGKEWILKYYEIDSDGMSTCDKEIADLYIRSGHKITNTYDIEIKTLSNILDMYLDWRHIDILSIDVEGMDMEVLESNNREKYKPDYIVLETMIYKSDDLPWIKDSHRFTDYLKNYWYIPIADTYVNTIYQLQK